MNLIKTKQNLRARETSRIVATVTLRNSCPEQPKHTEKSNILGRFVVHSLEENFVFLGMSVSVILGVVYIHGVTLTSVTGHF